MTDDTSIVRLATVQDTPAVVALCRLAAEEGQAYPMSEEKVLDKIQRALDRKHAICGVIGGPDEVRGSIYLEIGTLWYSDTWGLHEMWNIVHPDHRRSTYARVLIEFAKETATKLKLPLSIGVLSTPRTEAKIKLYERKLGKPVGAFFFYHGDGIR